MNHKNLLYKPYGLRARLLGSLIFSLLISALLFFLFYNTADYFISNYFEQSDFMENRIKKQGKSLQNYINSNNISSKNLKKLKNWERKQPLIFLEVYSNNKCIYSSQYADPDDLYYELNTNYENHIIPIQLEDIEVQALIYSDFAYQYYVIGTAVSAIIAVIIFISLFLYRNRKMILYICRLNEEIHILEGGNLEYEVSVEGNDEITDLAKSMNQMRLSFQHQLETEQTLYYTIRQMITEMSHDLRTPLTGIMLYIEILRSHKYTSEKELEEYLEKIDSKAHLLKQLSDHLFEYSLTEKTKNNKVMKSMKEAFKDVLKGFKEDLSVHGFVLIEELNWPPCFLDINEEYIERIFENISSNILKYAEPSVEIRINVLNTYYYCGLSIVNTIASSDHSIESNNIGLESIRNMMQQMKGRCIVEQTESIFEISLYFPKN